MRRRDLLVAGAMLAGNYAANGVFAQPARALTRAAVVIGVNTSGNLPVLSAAVSGAKLVADWLERENFEVHRFFDEGAPVTANPIYKAVKALAERGTIDQLVIYFSGHGFLSGVREEWWLLSEAPDNPNEAISVQESIKSAERSGIPNVAFISDACRSTPSSLGISSLHGQVIFPTTSQGNVLSDVDKFFATLPGDPAYETPVDESVSRFEGIYTTCFLNAFKRPYDGMAVILSDGTKVVPNRRMEKYLRQEVQRMAEEKSIKLKQIPDTQVLSEDTNYIGRLAADAVIIPTPRDGSQEATIFDVIKIEFNRVEGTPLSFPPAYQKAAEVAAIETGFSNARNEILTAASIDPSSLETGFTVSGSSVEQVKVEPGMGSQMGRQGELSAIEVSLESENGGSVAIQFSDGSGTVVAALKGFIGNIVVSSGQVTNVSYVPSAGNWRFADYQQERSRLDALRAVVATAARYGVFRIEGNSKDRSQQASQMASSIRVLKGIDPTLGIYAAYAYAEAGLQDQVNSVREYMISDLEVDLFDVAMLAGALSGGERRRTVPFCPMLQQGWGLIRVKDVNLRQDIHAARDHLRPSLWTTFDPEGMSIVLEAIGRSQ